MDLLDYLGRRFPYHTRAEWADRVRAGDLTLDQERACTDAPVRRGAVLAYRKQHREPWVDRDIRVLHEDDDLVVATKPAHLPSHADGPFIRNTFVHLLQQATGRPDLSLAHRLDRETSGVLVVAASRRARQELERQFREGTVRKRYLAVVRGIPATDRFTVDAAIATSPHGEIAIRRATVATGSPGAVPACTEFEVVAHGDGHAIVRCTPRTGRTHQIRVHLEAAGHPVLGDKLYGRPDADYLAFIRHVKSGGSPRWSADDGPDRHLLHALELTFVHPADGVERSFTAPVPADIAAFCNDAVRPDGGAA
jgi:23S rRNA pseudouridine1911/1915/1917 synthase